MAYEKLNLQDGDVLKAEHLSHMEEGIERASSADGIAEALGYTPADAETVSELSAEKMDVTTETVTTRYVNDYGTGDIVAPLKGYISATGSFASTAAWQSTDFVEITTNATVQGEFVNNSNISAVAFYDENKTFLSSLHHDSTSLNFNYKVDVVAPDGAKYVRFSFYNVSNGHQYASISETVVVEDFIGVAEYSYNTITNTAVANAYVNRSGELASTAAWCASDYFRINGAYSIDFKLYGTGSTSLVAFYDKQKKHISSVTNDTSGFHEMTNVVPPAGAYYMRYAVYSGHDSQYVNLKYKRIETLYVELERSREDNPLCGKIITATGDSITATVSYRPFSYAKIIALENGMTYENKAIWGATVASDIAGSSGCIFSTIETMRDDADYIILSGGANDFYALSAGRETLGEVSNGYAATLDTTTFCGAVEAMCKAAIEKWPGKKILYVITHRMLDINNAELQNWVAKLIEILNKWGIPYVDLWHDMPSLALPALKNLYTTMGNTEYTGTGDGLHPNEDGYRNYYVPRILAKLKAI